MKIRLEQSGDEQQIQLLVAKAFESNAEAKLVDVLRESGCAKLSLVALDNNVIIGHILFTPVKLDGDIQLKMLGLAPLSVSAEHQGVGIGSDLIKAGLNECKKLDYDAVVVLGAPKYYGRFGFKSASDFGINSVYEVEDEYFMLLEQRRGSLDGKSGIVRYHEAFAGF
jgi:putative acetyltransferase